MLPELLAERATVTATGCWMATAKPGTNGYVEVRLGGKRGKLHRLAYELLVGPVPAKHDVDHLCHNADLTCAGGPSCAHRACCNPEHLATRSRSHNVHAGVPGRRVCPHGSDRVRTCGRCTTARVRAHRNRAVAS